MGGIWYVEVGGGGARIVLSVYTCMMWAPHSVTEANTRIQHTYISFKKKQFYKVTYSVKNINIKWVKVLKKL